MVALRLPCWKYEHRFARGNGLTVVEMIQAGRFRKGPREQSVWNGSAAAFAPGPAGGPFLPQARSSVYGTSGLLQKPPWVTDPQVFRARFAAGYGEFPGLDAFVVQHGALHL